MSALRRWVAALIQDLWPLVHNDLLAPDVRADIAELALRLLAWLVGS